MNWGCSFNVLRTSTTALVYVPAEYGSHAWCQSAHTRILDSQLNEAMRIISGCTRSTPIDLIPFRFVAPPTTRRDMTCLQLHLKHKLNEPCRLRSRRPSRSFMENLTNHDYFPISSMQTVWSHISPVLLTPPWRKTGRAKHGSATELTAHWTRPF